MMVKMVKVLISAIWMRILFRSKVVAVKAVMTKVKIINRTNRTKTVKVETNSSRIRMDKTRMVSRMVDSKDNKTKMVRMVSNKVVLKVDSKMLTVSKVAVAHRAVSRMDKTKTDKDKADRTTLTETR